MYRRIPQKRPFGWPDILVMAFIAGLIYGLVNLAHEWATLSYTTVAIDLAPSALPRYSFFSLMRALAAYTLSLGFTLVYGYVAAKSRPSERILIPMLDILQSIPVLGFLPGMVLALVALFPNSNAGLEISCILAIFTGQAWNMTFGFYSSLKGVPTDLKEVSTVIRLNWFQRFKTVELPFAAISLAWNSLMSMAGGWFFLTICESFSLGDRKFQLPGIGSYMQTAIDRNDSSAIGYGLIAMFTIIIFVDFVIWRPVMAWVRKFQMEEIPEEIAELPFVTTLLRESWLIRRLKALLKRRRVRRHHRPIVSGPAHSVYTGRPLQLLEDIKRRIRLNRFWNDRVLARLGVPLTIVACGWGGTRLWELVRTLTPHDWRVIWSSVGLTLARVSLAILVGSLWTIPVGILIGLSPRLTRILQPFVQLAASFPAPMLYPLVTMFMLRLGFASNWNAAVLMMLGAQWYILFNVLAGAMGIKRDLKDTLTTIGVSKWSRWWNLYLPAAFPSLVTGWVTAAGGAWNASIVAEYVPYGDHKIIAPGIGSMISRASDSGNFPMLAGCLIAMVVTVVVLNRTWWRWLNDLAETRFRFER